MTEELERGAAALKAEVLSSIERWRGSLPSGDHEGSTLYLGIADRAITLTSALVHEVTQTLMRDEPLRDRATLGEHVGLIQRVGRKRHTSCLAGAGPLVSKSDSRTLDRFSALRNELAHLEGERFDVAALGRYRPERVAEILDVAASIANMRIVDETICQQTASDTVRPGGATGTP